MTKESIKRLIGAGAGFVCGLLLVTVGFWGTLLVALLTGLGFWCAGDRSIPAWILDFLSRFRTPKD